MELMYWWILPVGILAGAAVAWWFLRRDKDCRHRAVAHTDRLTALPEYRDVLRRHRRLLAVMAGSAVVLLLAALAAAARPVSATVTTLAAHSRDIMLCLDTSASMASADAAIVGVFQDLAREFDGERIGLMMFDSSAAQVFPLTDDYQLVAEQLARARNAFEGGPGDAAFFAGTGVAPGSSLIGDGLASCSQGFPGPDDGSRSRSLVLATDNFISGDPIFTLAEAAALARDKGIRIHALNPADFDYGDKPGQEGATLRAAAESTGGAYYPVDSPAAVGSIVREVQRTEAAARQGAPQRVVTDESAWPLGVALLAGLVLVGLAWRVDR